MSGRDRGILTTMMLAVLAVCAITIQLHSAPVATHRPATAARSNEGQPAATDSISRFAISWRSGDFTRARCAAEKLDDERVRRQVLELVRFGEAGSALEQKHVKSATRIAGDYPAGIKRVLLLIAVGSLQAESGDRTAASESLQQATEEARHAGAKQRTTPGDGVTRVPHL